MIPTSLLLAAILPLVVATCTSSIDCSLNGVCDSGSCKCNAPWTGPQCGILGFKPTPDVGGSIYPTSDPRNAWGGGIILGQDNKYYAYTSVYPSGLLGGANVLMIGVADKVEGPYNYTAHDNCFNPKPYAAKYKNGTTLYTLWCGGSEVRVSEKPQGPFWVHHTGPGVNPAPLYDSNSDTWYATTQPTNRVFTAKTLDGPWTTFARLPRVNKKNSSFTPEDPFMYKDAQGNWHIVMHMYTSYEHLNCSTSVVSGHIFSADGKNWTSLPTYEQPYGHEITFANGTTNVYSTLERPFLVLDSNNQITHALWAADIATGNEGCSDRPGFNRHGFCPCVNCKYHDKAYTVLASFDV